MPTRRKFRKNNRKSRKLGKKGGQGDPTALDPEKVADYYYNKAMTQVYEFDDKGVKVKKILIRTPKTMLGKKLLQKRADAAKDKGHVEDETFDDIGKYIWFSEEFNDIRENSEWKKDTVNMKFGLDGMAGLGNSAILLEVCLMLVSHMKGDYFFQDGLRLQDKGIERVWEEDWRILKENPEKKYEIEWGNVHKYINEGITDLNDNALFGGDHKHTRDYNSFSSGVMFNLLNEPVYKCVKWKNGNCTRSKIVGKAYDPSKYPKGKYEFPGGGKWGKDYMEGMEALYKKIIKFFVVKFNNEKSVSGGRKRRRRKKKRTRRKRRKKGKKSRRRRRR